MGPGLHFKTPRAPGCLPGAGSGICGIKQSGRLSGVGVAAPAPPSVSRVRVSACFLTWFSRPGSCARPGHAQGTDGARLRGRQGLYRRPGLFCSRLVAAASGCEWEDPARTPSGASLALVEYMFSGGAGLTALGLHGALPLLPDRDGSVLVRASPAAARTTTPTDCPRPFPARRLWRTTTSRRTLRRTSRRSLTPSSTLPGTASWGATSAHT